MITLLGLKLPSTISIDYKNWRPLTILKATSTLSNNPIYFSFLFHYYKIVLHKRIKVMKIISIQNIDIWTRFINFLLYYSNWISNMLILNSNLWEVMLFKSFYSFIWNCMETLRYMSNIININKIINSVPKS